MTTTPLTYADPSAPYLTRAFINCVESLCGRGALVKIYEQWRQQWTLSGLSLWSSALYWLGVTMRLEGEPWPPVVARDERLELNANHPFRL
jgi:hypothetical protein